MVKQHYHTSPDLRKCCGLLLAAAPPAWTIFTQSFAEHWAGFQHVHPRYHTHYYDSLVDKRLRCGAPAQIGSLAYRCRHCGQGKHRVAMSCTSSLCWRCAKVYVDNGVSQGSQMLQAGIIYRHSVLTMPALLRPTFYQQAQAFLSPFRRCGVRCVAEVFSRGSGKALKGGYIVVLQTQGRNGQYNPPLHVIATSGGWDAAAQPWRHLDSVPYALWRKKWQWHLLTMLRQTVKTPPRRRLVETGYTR